MVPTPSHHPVETPLGDEIRAIWGSVLDVADIQPTDDFFEIGGHSLLAVEVTAHIRSALNITVPLRLLFLEPVLEDFVTAVSDLAAA